MKRKACSITATCKRPTCKDCFGVKAGVAGDRSIFGLLVAQGLVALPGDCQPKDLLVSDSEPVSEPAKEGQP